MQNIQQDIKNNSKYIQNPPKTNIHKIEIAIVTSFSHKVQTCNTETIEIAQGATKKNKINIQSKHKHSQDKVTPFSQT